MSNPYVNFNLSRADYPYTKRLVCPDGKVCLIGTQQDFGGFEFTGLYRYSWMNDYQFNIAYNFSISGTLTEYDVAITVLQNQPWTLPNGTQTTQWAGQVWNPVAPFPTLGKANIYTWQQLQAGGTDGQGNTIEVTDAEGNAYQGDYAVNFLLDLYWAHVTTQSAEESVQAWLTSYFVVQQQALFDKYIAIIANQSSPPGPIADPAADQQFPPQQDDIPNSAVLWYAASSLLTSTPDPNNPQRIIIGVESPPSN